MVGRRAAWTGVTAVGVLLLAACGGGTSADGARGLEDALPIASVEASPAPSKPVGELGQPSEPGTAVSPSSTPSGDAAPTAPPQAPAGKLQADATPAEPPAITPARQSLSLEQNKKMTPSAALAVTGMSTDGLLFELGDCDRLPQGLRLNASTGVVTGTPLAAGMANCVVVATNDDGDAARSTLSIAVLAPPPPPVVQTLDITAVRGVNWDLQVGTRVGREMMFLARGNPAYRPGTRFAFSVSPDLPAGLVLGIAPCLFPGGCASDGSGRFIYGTPEAEQPATDYVLSATAPDGTRGSITVRISVKPAPPRPIVATVTPRGQTIVHRSSIGIVPGQKPFIVSGFDSPPAFVSSPPLPDGLTLDPATGMVTGLDSRYTNPLTYPNDPKEFRLTATDSSGRTVQVLLVIDYKPKYGA